MIWHYAFVIAAGAGLFGAARLIRALIEPACDLHPLVGRACMYISAHDTVPEAGEEERVARATQRMRADTQTVAHAATDGYMHEAMHGTTPSMHKSLRS